MSKPHLASWLFSTDEESTDPHNPWYVDDYCYSDNEGNTIVLLIDGRHYADTRSYVMKDRESAIRVATERNNTIPDRHVFKYRSPDYYTCTICGEPDWDRIPDEESW